LEGSGRGLIEVLAQHFSGGAEEKVQETSIRITDVLADIQIECIPNMTKALMVHQPVITPFIVIFWPFFQELGRGHTKETGNRNATAISKKCHQFQADNWFPD
jgi:hypothetical protein